MPRESTEQPLLPSTAQDINVDLQETETEIESISTAPLANMGITLSTARWLAPLSFVVDFLAQQYGILIAKPNMQQLHEKYPASFSPWAYAIGGFFGPQQLLQLFWLREFFRDDKDVEEGTVRYAGWYALGNFCISIWMGFWCSDNLPGAMVPVLINTLTQTYYTFFLRDKNPKTYQSKMTNAVNITMAGIGILDVFHNGSAGFYSGVPPTNLVKLATSIAAPLTALFSPLLFSACIAYDLLGVSIGQHVLAKGALNGLGGGGGEGWSRLIGALGLGAAGIVGLRHLNGAQWL